MAAACPSAWVQLQADIVEVDGSATLAALAALEGVANPAPPAGESTMIYVELDRRPFLQNPKNSAKTF